MHLSALFGAIKGRELFHLSSAGSESAAKTAADVGGGRNTKCEKRETNTVDIVIITVIYLFPKYLLYIAMFA